jgi:signal transduction histidine kinase
MIVSIAFSITIFRMTAVEIERFARNQQNRIQRRWENLEFLPFDVRKRMMTPPIMDLELLKNTKHRIAVLLILINGSIMIFSGGLGYYLSGKTLHPIKRMLDEQKRFVSDASHEFRTPLSALKIAMEVHLRDKKLTLTQAKQLITNNLSEVNKLQSLSDNLLELAEYENNKQSIAYSKEPFHTILENTIKKLSPLTKEKNIAFKKNIQECTICGDSDKLTSLCTILLDNAIKYTSKNGSIDVLLKKDKKSAVLTIKDNGIGIPKKDIPHVFDRFYRSDSARTKNGKNGFGLGLPIAKKIVETHHGHISITSKANKGTTVKILLPVNS